MKSEELLLQRVRSSFQRIDRIHNATRDDVAPELRKPSTLQRPCRERAAY